MVVEATDAGGEAFERFWKAGAIEPIDPEQNVGKALIGGINFRIHLVKALIAAWKTADAAA